MKLYLIQHAQAKTKDEDPERGLTEEGKENIHKTALFFKSRVSEVKEIWHSGKKRAFETAEILTEILDGQIPLLEKDYLAPGDDTARLLRELDNLAYDLVIVGHMPFLSKLTSALLASSRETVHFKNAGIVCLTSGEHWTLEWIVIPGLI